MDLMMAATVGNPGSAAAAAALARNRAQSPSTLAPAGLETFYHIERSNIANSFEAFVLPIHWSIIRGGLRLRLNHANIISGEVPMSELTERLPADWKTNITTRTDEGTQQPLKQLVLRYWDYTDVNHHYKATLTEIVKNTLAVVILFRAANSNGPDGTLQEATEMVLNDGPQKNASATNFQLSDYITSLVLNFEGETTSPMDNRPWYDAYKNLEGLENRVWEQLMDPLGLKASGKPKKADPYESKVAPEKNRYQQQQQQQQQQPYNPMTYVPPPQILPSYPTGGIGGPLYNPPPLMPVGGGGVGRSDMDPLGGFGAGNVADPRGFRAPPSLPFGGGAIGGLPPGARFDPFGPPNPIPAGVRPPPGTPGTGGGGNTFGAPSPDAEQPPPGFDDMFM